MFLSFIFIVNLYFMATYWINLNNKRLSCNENKFCFAQIILFLWGTSFFSVNYCRHWFDGTKHFPAEERTCPSITLRLHIGSFCWDCGIVHVSDEDQWSGTHVFMASSNFIVYYTVTASYNVHSSSLCVGINTEWLRHMCTAHGQGKSATQAFSHQT